MVVTAVGGFTQPNPDTKDKQTYPTTVKLDLRKSEKGWTNVTMGEKQVHRNGFMSTKVPISWIKRLPFATFTTTKLVE